MQLSARNQLSGTVKSMAMDGIMAEIVVTVADGVELVSVITKASALRLGLEVGKSVTVVVKSTEVMLATE
jgi:molybdopterin-binding protein